MMSNINLDGFLDIASSDDPLPDNNDRNGEPSSTPKGHKRKKPQNTHREFVLKDWLASLSLSEYYNLLYKEGYDKPLSLKVLTDEDLIELGIKKKGHRLILLNAVKDEYFSSLAANPSFFYGYGANHSQPRLPPPIHDQPNHQHQQNKMRTGQQAPMGFAHSDSPSDDSEVDDIPEPTNLSSSQHLDQSHHFPSSEQLTPQSPHSHKPALRASPSGPTSQYQSPGREGQSPGSQPRLPPQRFQDENEDEDDEEEDSPLSHSQPLYPSPPQQAQNLAALNLLKARVNAKQDSQASSYAPPSHTPPTLNTPSKMASPLPQSQIQPPQLPQPSVPTTTATTPTLTATGESTPKPRKRSRPDKPEQPTTEPEGPPKPKPSAISFIPKQHYSRADIHDCLGGQRFCAISTPSAYPFILIFAHYQAYVGEDGMWEHCASGDLNKGVNRGVITAKEKKKRLLLFFSMSGQQGAVLFLGEVNMRYVSSEQKEEKNSKGVDKACVIFKFQRIGNDAITINLCDFRAAEALAAQPKPVIRSLTEDPNTYYLDSTYQSNFNVDLNPSNTNTPNNSLHYTTTSNSSTAVTNSNFNNNSLPRKAPPPSTTVTPTRSSIIPITSPSSSSPSLTSVIQPPIDHFPLSHSSSLGLLPIKKERAKEEFINNPPLTTTLPSGAIANLTRTSISKITGDAPNLTTFSRILNPEDDRHSEEWANGINSITNFVPVNNHLPTSPPNTVPTIPSSLGDVIPERTNEAVNNARISNILSHNDLYGPSYEHIFNTSTGGNGNGTNNTSSNNSSDTERTTAAYCTVENSMGAESVSAHLPRELVTMETN